MQRLQRSKIISASKPLLRIEEILSARDFYCAESQKVGETMGKQESRSDPIIPSRVLSFAATSNGVSL